MACAAAKSLADQDRFICIYPAYLNNKKTIAEGRRIHISKKNQIYSREWMNHDVQYRDRVQVQLKQEDGSLCLVQFPSWKSVMLYVAEIIPKLKIRTQKTDSADPSLLQGEGSKKGKGKKKK
ncbi:signal recognition particle 19 kDa protein-like isoform X2 [Onychomys torridus]|uniref:signal recognition particle 19 kDa protein-like isoform X2 n=1 Tax=Onychomys torridus TaxID=38674 RepID=UPI00167F2167|nr:signal recognition particle 19 kDa protein-like isoform X2 [Onychomys torridus]